MYVQGVSTRKVAAITEELWVVPINFCKKAKGLSPV